MLTPKKVKFRKWQTLRRNPARVTPDTRGTAVSFGSHGLKAMTAGRVRSNQLESARKAISRQMEKTGRMWCRIFPDMPFTQKPAEVKMGSGKGDVQGYQTQVWAGRILFEVDGLDDVAATIALRKGGAKLPIKTKIVKRS